MGALLEPGIDAAAAGDGGLSAVHRRRGPHVGWRETARSSCRAAQPRRAASWCSTSRSSSSSRLQFDSGAAEAVSDKSEEWLNLKHFNLKDMAGVDMAYSQ